MATIEKALPIIFEHEGGLVDNPHDPGGVTNFGWSLRFFDKAPNLVERYFGHPPPIARADIRNLTKDKAALMYNEIIWEPNHYGLLADQTVATKIFDTTINMGEKWGEILAQQSANRLGCNLAVDGQLGPVSMAAINTLDPNTFLKEYQAQQRERYEHIVHDRPESSVFLSNWLRRAAWPTNVA